MKSRIWTILVVAVLFMIIATIPTMCEEAHADSYELNFYDVDNNLWRTISAREGEICKWPSYEVAVDKVAVWYIDESRTNRADNPITVSTSANFYLKIEQKRIKITYIYGQNKEIHEYEVGNITALEQIEGKSIEGFYKDEYLCERIENIGTLYEDTELYVKVSDTVSISVDGEKKDYPYMGKIKIPQKENYEVVGVYKDEQFSEEMNMNGLYASDGMSIFIKYVRTHYNVTYVYGQNELVERQDVGEPFTIKTVDGVKRWCIDEQKEKDFVLADDKKLKGDITLYGVMEGEEFVVCFYTDDGELIKSETVKRGKSATAPTVKIYDGYRFVGWSNDFTNVRGNVITVAEYEKSSDENVEKEKGSLTIEGKEIVGIVVSAVAVVGIIITIIIKKAAEKRAAGRKNDRN